MNKPEPPLFPTILASTVHDIKSSLGIVLELIRQLAAKQPNERSNEFSQLQFEANRINHSLIQLLVMYKIDASLFDLDIDVYSAIDILHEACAQQHALASYKRVKIDINCPEDLFCYCDFPNTCNALGTMLNNALRYTSNTILLSASQEQDYLRLCIEDDGAGFPEHLLQANLSAGSNPNWVSGNTGLGLYFVSVIASLHKTNQKIGYVAIDNESRLGGARFNLFLP